MESCFFGAGCTRPGCIYRHDRPTTASNTQSKEPCMAYLAGYCSFNARTCRKRHPLPEEAERLRTKYSQIRCRFGNECHTEGCLYRHQALVEPPTLPTPVPTTTTQQDYCIPVPQSTAVPGTSWRPTPPKPPSVRPTPPQPPKLPPTAPHNPPYSHTKDVNKQSMMIDSRLPSVDAPTTTTAVVDEATVGLSPAYWAHVPMTIRQVQQLQGGWNVLHLPKPGGEYTNDSPKQQENDDNGRDNRASSTLALSKCSLVGLLVAVEPKGDGNVAYVLDDGTGLIDVVYWGSDDADDDDGLPSLGNDKDDEPRLTVGTTVQVWGRIVAAAMQGKDVALREIHASLLLPKTTTDELQHWQRCVQIINDGSLTTSAEITQRLGHEIGQQIANRESLPSADSDGAWRVYGMHCQCTNNDLPYKDTLLYCHCVATREPMDPELRFRDALLSALLKREQEQSGPTGNEPLRFQFHNLSHLGLLVDNGQPPSTDLLRRTVGALRQDGIVHLLDEASDTYVLISKDRVLIPYMDLMLSNDIERVVQRMQLQREPPEFLEKVPKARLQYVRRKFKQAKQISAAQQGLESANQAQNESLADTGFNINAKEFVPGRGFG